MIKKPSEKHGRHINCHLAPKQKKQTIIALWCSREWMDNGRNYKTGQESRNAEWEIRKRNHSLQCSEPVLTEDLKSRSEEVEDSSDRHVLDSLNIHMCVCVWVPLCLWWRVMTLPDYEAQETCATLWLFSVTVAVCAPLFFFLSQMAHVIPSASCLVSFKMGYDEPSISSRIYWSHRGKRRKWGRQRVPQLTNNLQKFNLWLEPFRYCKQIEMTGLNQTEDIKVEINGNKTKSVYNKLGLLRNRLHERL